MYNYDGILYRIWGVAGVFILVGLGCIIVSRMNKKVTFDKECFYAGICCIIFGIVTASYYGYCYFFPQVERMQCTFVEQRRDSRVAPPLPLTMEYIFIGEEGYCAFYLDELSKEDVMNEVLLTGNQYDVYYESKTDIIVGINASK